MKSIFILFSMLFAHIVDDYCLQGILASMKQKKWWEQNAPQKLYKYDYIVALIMHSFSWAFVIMIPIMIFLNFEIGWLVFLIIPNTIIHALTDNAKANKSTINLIQDQSIHIIQILITYGIFILC